MPSTHLAILAKILAMTFQLTLNQISTMPIQSFLVFTLSPKSFVLYPYVGFNQGLLLVTPSINLHETLSFLELEYLSLSSQRPSPFSWWLVFMAFYMLREQTYMAIA
jgi:hypothetical protein